MNEELKKCSGCHEIFFKFDLRCFRVLITVYSCRDCEEAFGRFEEMVESWNDE